MKPCFIIDHISNRFALNTRIVKIRILSRRVISPNRHIGDIRDLHSRFFSQLGFRSKLIQTSHCKPAIRRNIFGIVHRNVTICITRITNNQNTNITCCILLNSQSLASENFTIDPKKIFSFHSCLTRNTTHKQCPINIIESRIEIRCQNKALQGRKCTIIQLHCNTFQDFHRWFDFNKMENNRLIRSKNSSGCQAEQKTITDLTGGSGHSNSNWFIHDINFLLKTYES